jgi:thioredoxin 1
MADVVEINEENFEADVIGCDKPVLVDFWAPWCGPCRMMHPILDELAEELAGKAIIGRCNVDDSPELAGRYGITAIPTILLFKGGELSDTMVGVTPAEALKEKLSGA